MLLSGKHYSLTKSFQEPARFYISLYIFLYQGEGEEDKSQKPELRQTIS